MFGAQAEMLVEALGEVLGGTWRVRAELGGEQAALPVATAPRSAPVEPSAPSDWPTPARPGGGDGVGAGPDAGLGAGLGADAKPTAPRPAPKGRASKGRGGPAPVARTPARETAAEPAFDPGDEPIDDAVDPASARQSSEEQAIRLLAEHLGAERIGEPDPRA
jgi:DNA polymerase-3 subunit gamma/tau